MDTFQIGRFTVRREVAVLAGLFIIGLGVGLVAARLLVGQPRVTSADYAVLVARIYELERSTGQAEDRLRAAGIASPADAVARMAEQYPATPGEAARDAESLRELARALGRPVAEAGAPAPASRPMWWALPLLVFILAIGLGCLFAVRILGISTDRLPRLRLPRLPWPRPRTRPSANGRAPAPAPIAPVTRRPAPPTPPVVLDNPILVSRRSPGGTAPVAERANGVRAETASPTRAATAPPTRRQFSFRSSYRLGDEPYDEIHPISGGGGGALVGACGVSAARQLTESSPARYWAFTAWVHDYVSDEQKLKAIGLVSKWAYLNFGDEIDEWLSTGEIDELKQVDAGAFARLETSNLSVSLTVDEYEYGEGAPPEAWLSCLAAQFDVELRLPREEERSRSEAAGWAG